MAWHPGIPPLLPLHALCFSWGAENIQLGTPLVCDGAILHKFRLLEQSSKDAKRKVSAHVLGAATYTHVADEKYHHVSADL